MRGLLLTVAILISVVALAQPQPPDTLWTRVYGGAGIDQCNHMEPTADGGWVLTGFKNQDVWIIKTDSLGIIQWDHTFGGAGPDVGLFASEIANGDFLLFCIGCIDNVHCGTWVVRLDSDGNNPTQTLLSNAVAESVRRTADHGFIVAGSVSVPQEDIWFLKTDSTGSEEWSTVLVSVADQEANCVSQTHDGGYILGGQQQHGRARLDRTTATGGLVWTQYYFAADESSCPAVTETEDGGFVFAGFLRLPFGDENFSLTKVTAQGDSVWRHTYGTAADELAYDMIPTRDHGYLLVGERQSADSAWVVKTDSAGTLLWSQAYGHVTGALFEAVQQTADGGYLLGGQANGDLWLVRLASETVVPHGVSVYYAGEDLVLRWAADRNPSYRIYSSPSPDGPFTDFIGSTTARTFTVPGGATADRKFFVVVGQSGQ